MVLRVIYTFLPCGSLPPGDEGLIVENTARETAPETIYIPTDYPTDYFGLNGFLETAKTLCTCEMFTQ